ncbi:MAG TPA: hypothetical protein VIH45_05690 [Desulfuromonadaceae bacterium]
MENFENIHEMERQDTQHKLPAGWLLIFVGLIAFVLYYCAAYTPEISGWSQVKAYEESLKK